MVEAPNCVNLMFILPIIFFKKGPVFPAYFCSMTFFWKMSPVSPRGLAPSLNLFTLKEKHCTHGNQALGPGVALLPSLESSHVDKDRFGKVCVWRIF